MQSERRQVAPFHRRGILSAAVSALYIVEGLGGSRRSRDGVAGRVVEAAADAGWTPSIVSLSEMAQRVGDAGVEVARVVLCGGDGLIHRALPYLASTGVDVAVVPVGSGNDFARAFGIGAEEAVRLATAPADSRAPSGGVDVIEVPSDAARARCTCGKRAHRWLHRPRQRNREQHAISSRISQVHGCGAARNRASQAHRGAARPQRRIR